MINPWRPKEAAESLSGLAEPESKGRTPWLMCTYCLLLTVIPANLASPLFLNSISTPARLLAGLFIFLAILSFLHTKDVSDNVQLNPGILVLCFYLSLLLIVWGLGLLATGSQAQEFFKKSAISIAIVGVGIGIYAVIRLTTARDRSVVLGCLLAGITYSAFVGILQHTAKINLADMTSVPGFPVIPGSAQKEAIRYGSIRAYGTFLQPLPFGTLCAASVPLAIHFARYASRRWVRALSGLAALTLLAAVPTSIARSSLIVLAVAMGFYAATLPFRRIATALIALAFTYVLIAITSPSTLQALSDTIVNSSDDPSLLIRLDQLDAMAATFREHPLSGIGLGAVTAVDFGPVDSYLALSAAEGGILWIAAFATLSLGGIFGIAATGRRSPTTASRDQNLAVGAMFLGLLASTPSFASLSYDPIYSIFFLLFGILWSSCSYPMRAPIAERPDQKAVLS